MKTTYYIDRLSEAFASLDDAKAHIADLPQHTRYLFLRNCAIIGISNGNIVSITPIVVTECGYYFEKTITPKK